MTNLQRRKDSTEKSASTVIKAVAILSIVPTLFHLSRRIPFTRGVQLEAAEVRFRDQRELSSEEIACGPNHRINDIYFGFFKYQHRFIYDKCQKLQ